MLARTKKVVKENKAALAASFIAGGVGAALVIKGIKIKDARYLVKLEVLAKAIEDAKRTGVWEWECRIRDAGNQVWIMTPEQIKEYYEMLDKFYPLVLDDKV